MIEGFGDDVVTLFGGSLILSIAITCLCIQCTRHTDIHSHSDPPQSEPTNGTPAVARPAHTYGDDGEECPICLDAFGDSVVTTNCGHSFDFSCFMDYAAHQTRPNRVSCPTCRQAVSLLFPNFDTDAPSRVAVTSPGTEGTAGTAGAERRRREQSRRRHLESFRQYNRINGNVPRTFYEVIRDIPELTRQIFLDARLSRQILTTAKIMKFVLLLLATCLYLLSPLDLVPESMFGAIGLIDDLLLVVIYFIYVTSIFRNLYVSQS